MVCHLWDKIAVRATWWNCAICTYSNFKRLKRHSHWDEQRCIKKTCHNQINKRNECLFSLINGYYPVYVFVWSDMIGMRTRAPKSNEGKMVNGRETLRLRSKGAATVQEVVSFTVAAGKWLLISLMYSDSDIYKWKCTAGTRVNFDLRFFVCVQSLDSTHTHTHMRYP